MKRTLLLGMTALALTACEEQLVMPELEEEAVAAENNEMEGVAFVHQACVIETFDSYSGGKPWTSQGYTYSGPEMRAGLGGLRQITFSAPITSVTVQRTDGQPFTLARLRFRYEGGKHKMRGSKGGTFEPPTKRNEWRTVSLSNDPRYHDITLFQWEAQRRTTGAGSLGAGTIDDLLLCSGPGNYPPAAEAGPAWITVEATGTTTPVTLDASSSSDPDGDALTYTWTGAADATGVAPTFDLPVGDHSFTLTVEDGNGQYDVDFIQVRVEDETAPEIVFDAAKIGDDDDLPSKLGTIRAVDLVDGAPVLSVSDVTIEQIGGEVDDDDDDDDDEEEDRLRMKVKEKSDGSVVLRIRGEGDEDATTIVTAKATARDASWNSVSVSLTCTIPGEGDDDDDDDADDDRRRTLACTVTPVQPGGGGSGGGSGLGDPPGTGGGSGGGGGR